MRRVLIQLGNFLILSGVMFGACYYYSNVLKDRYKHECSDAGGILITAAENEGRAACVVLPPGSVLPTGKIRVF